MAEQNDRVNRGIAKMASGARRAFVFGAGFHIVRGWQFDWTLFRVLPEGGRPLVREEPEGGLRRRMGNALHTSGRGHLGGDRVEQVELRPRFRSGRLLLGSGVLGLRRAGGKRVRRLFGRRLIDLAFAPAPAEREKRDTGCYAQYLHR